MSREPPYDPVLDEHIDGAGAAKRYVHRVFARQRLRVDVWDDPEPASVRFPITAFAAHEPWARTTADEAVNVALSFAQAGGLVNGAVAHGWIHPAHYLQAWDEALDLNRGDPSLPGVAAALDRISRHIHHEYVAEHTADLLRVIQASPQAVHTPAVRLTEHGTLVLVPDGIRRAGALMLANYRSPDPHLMPVYVAASGASTAGPDGTSTLPGENDE